MENMCLKTITSNTSLLHDFILTPVCRDDLSVVSFSDFGKTSTRSTEEVKTQANGTVLILWVT